MTVSVVADWVSDQRTMTSYEDVLSSNGTQEAGSLPRSHSEVRWYLPLKPTKKHVSLQESVRDELVIIIIIK